MNPSGGSLLCCQPGAWQGGDVQTFATFAAETSDVAKQPN